MKILLIKSCWPYPYSKGEHTYNRIWPPLSLANCAAILEKQGHKVRILDAHALRIKPNKIKPYLDGFDKIFINSSSLDRWQCPNIDIEPFLETVQHVKKVSDEVYVLGYHGTVDPKSILEKTGAKAIIRGEPEYIVSDICQKKNLSDIEGISYKKNSKVVSNPDRSSFDLKFLPTPAYHLLDMKKYTYEILGNNFALFETARGCKYSCKFCNKIMYGQKLRTKTKEQILEEIRVAVEERHVKTGYFIDLQFFSNKEIVHNICDFLISKNYNFKWCCQTRPESLDKDLLTKMKKAGCRLIHFGVESGLESFLDFTGKNITLKKVIESLEICRTANIQTLAFFIFGFRGETEKEREETFKFAKLLNTDFVSFHKVYPYEQSDIYLPDIKFNKEIDKFIRKATLGYYLRFSTLKRLNITIILRSLRLFLGRIATL